ncbi:MAG: SigE family RNA polymerase sigma factor [Actinomycetota bacterium]|nr:SigE family RNA polymerase sigma factor [Actinomycetota bacterium]
MLHAADLLTGDRHRAQDLVQSAYAKAYLRWARLKDQQPEAYVRQCMLNEYLDWYRRRRWREAPLTLDAEALAGAIHDEATSVAERDAVLRALRELTPRERSVIVLRYWFDLTELQIADHLGIAPGTVKSTAARALHRLREMEHVSPHQQPRATTRNGSTS